MIKEKLTKVIRDIVGNDVLFVVDTPQHANQGEYATNVAMVVFSALEGQTFQGLTFKSPRALAEELVQKLSSDKSLSEMVEKIEIAGPGFINFFLKNTYLIKELQTVLREDQDYGKSTIGKGKLAIVEYSSPNIAKPFTVGHFRSTVIGDAVANLLEATGWNVTRDNHLGDWGTQFGKQIYAIKTWGDEKAIADSKNPVKDLVALYVKFHEEAEKDSSLVDKGREWFKRLEQGDAEARRIWKLCIDWSFKEFDRIYKLLGVSFHGEFENGRGLGESYFEDKMQVVIDDLESKGLLKEGEGGAKLVFFPDEKYPPAMILKSNGTTLYHTRDLATDLYRKRQYDPDLIVNEVGAEQTLYFRQLFEMEKMLGWYGEEDRVHVAHGLIRFKEGKMSTRKGNVIWLEDLIQQAITKAESLSSNKGKTGLERPLVLHPKHASGKPLSKEDFSDFQKQLAVEVGIGALKWNDLKREPKTEITFDWDEVLSMQGNSGPYIQYTYARCQSVLAKAVSSKQSAEGVDSDIIASDSEAISEHEITTSTSSPRNDKVELNIEELELLRSYPNYLGVIENAAKNYSPNILCNYLYDLAQKYNSFYSKYKILSDEVKHEVRSTKYETNSNVQSYNDKNASELENSSLDIDSDLNKQDFRLALTQATAIILKNGLRLLGIQAPEKM